MLLVIQPSIRHIVALIVKLNRFFCISHEDLQFLLIEYAQPPRIDDLRQTLEERLALPFDLLLKTIMGDEVDAKTPIIACDRRIGTVGYQVDCSSHSQVQHLPLVTVTITRYDAHHLLSQTSIQFWVQ